MDDDGDDNDGGDEGDDNAGTLYDCAGDLDSELLFWNNGARLWMLVVWFAVVVVVVLGDAGEEGGAAIVWGTHVAIIAASNEAMPTGS